MNKANTVLISGAGIAGPTLAYWLFRHGFTPTLIERALALRTGGYIMDFWGVGFDVAEQMQLVPQLRQAGYRVREVLIVNDEGRRIGGFSTDRSRQALRDRFVSILRGDLARQLYATVDGRVETIVGDEIRSLREDEEGITVEFDHASPRRFDLVVGADGLHSAVRRLVFGPASSWESYLGYCAAAFAIDGYPHRDEGAYVSYCVPGREVARFALRDGQTVFFLIFEAPVKPVVEHHDANTQKAILCQAFGDAGWECPEIVKALDTVDELYFDPVSQIRLEQWHRGRVALVGDAAFCPSLLAGQGAALAVTSAYLLAGELERAGGNFRAAYPAYENRLKPFIEAKQRQAAMFARQFAPKTRLGLLVRNVMSRLLDAPLIGDLMVKRMFGDRLKLPDYT
ncbi:MAG TPA: FAD-binding domain [Stellaceae bacterium]|nr:FAD-binding domain [Stellaceae bacterium]